MGSEFKGIQRGFPHFDYFHWTTVSDDRHLSVTAFPGGGGVIIYPELSRTAQMRIKETHVVKVQGGLRSKIHCILYSNKI